MRVREVDAVEGPAEMPVGGVEDPHAPKAIGTDGHGADAEVRRRSAERIRPPCEVGHTASVE
ncbi:hypothetical protein GCM10009755_19660 [Brevibacterium samyangense]|uniref:Uncharacterized protein n=1 Tax=Brevibacterium samyangense TaxID=366888 RepID=A0ABN2THM2_9MICO